MRHKATIGLDYDKKTGTRHLEHGMLPVDRPHSLCRGYNIQAAIEY
jgi:hypothetical protein